jgi:deazaflavin-dependent oxidoreductase (nitroreductase family)
MPPTTANRSEEESDMPLPRWLAEVNKRVFNRWELKRGVRPVLIHVGRTSGKTYETPLDAHRVEGGYIFICNYGSRSDWVQNVLAAGAARLRIGDTESELVEPRLLAAEEAIEQLPAGTKTPPRSMNVTEFLRMDLTG